MTTTVSDNTRLSRYEIHVGSELAGFVEYELNGQRIAFNHTETFPEFAGQGLARVLVAYALDEAGRKGRLVLPFCPYVRKTIAGNLEGYLDLVPPEERARFDLPSTPEPSNAP